MPKCHLTQEFLEQILNYIPHKSIHYYDKEIVGFLLEHRPSGIGTWYFRYYNAQKKMRYYSIGNTDNFDAIAARECAYTMASLVRHGGDPREKLAEGLAHKNGLTVEQFALECYLPQIKLKKRSWSIDLRILKQYILPVFSDRVLCTVKRMDIVMWQNTLPKQGDNGLAASSCNRVLAVMKCLFNAAVRWGFLDMGQNPCRNVSAIPEPIPPTRYLTKYEAWQVMTALQAMKNNNNALALQLLLLTGARKQEIITARWEHTHLDDRILTVPLSKSGKMRHIPLSNEAVALIQNLPRHPPSPWLFPSKNPEKPIQHLFYTWNKVRQKLGLGNVRIHDLRHSFASILVNAGCTLYEVQRILGHSDPKVTMRYAHLAQSSLVEAANCISTSIRSVAKQEQNKTHWCKTGGSSYVQILFIYNMVKIIARR